MFFFLHRKEVLGFQFLDTGPSYCTKRTLCIVNPKFMLHMLRALSFYLFIIITSRGRVPNANVLIRSALFCLLRGKDKNSFFFEVFLAQITPKAFPTTKAPFDCGVGVVPHGDENLIIPHPHLRPLLPPPQSRPPRPTFPTFRGRSLHQRLPYPGPSSCCEVLIKISGILPP